MGKTLNIALEASDQMYVPVEKTWRLNERMYGGLTSLDKKETVKKHGAEQVQVWRRSFDVPPPPLEKDSPYHPCKEDEGRRRFVARQNDERPLLQHHRDSPFSAPSRLPRNSPLLLNLGRNQRHCR